MLAPSPSGIVVRNRGLDPPGGVDLDGRTAQLKRGRAHSSFGAQDALVRGVLTKSPTNARFPSLILCHISCLFRMNHDEIQKP